MISKERESELVLHSTKTDPFYLTKYLSEQIGVLKKSSRVDEFLMRGIRIARILIAKQLFQICDSSIEFDADTKVLQSGIEVLDHQLNFGRRSSGHFSIDCLLFYN